VAGAHGGHCGHAHGGGVMITLGAVTRVHLLAGATDMRMGFDGLYALARGLLEADPLSGHVFGFCNQGRNRLKLLYWDGSGLWVCAKRLDKGRFAWPDVITTSCDGARSSTPASPHSAQTGQSPSRHVVMSQTELAMLLSGIDLQTSRKRAWHRIESHASAAP
jgi:transposase